MFLSTIGQVNRGCRKYQNEIQHETPYETAPAERINESKQCINSKLSEPPIKGSNDLKRLRRCKQ